MAGQLFRDMEKAIWRGKLSLQVKLRIYNACVLSVLLYAADTWSLLVGDEKRIDAFDMRCQRRILGVRWYDFVTNETIRQQTGLLPLSLIMRKRRLALFGHTVRSPASTDNHMALRSAIFPPTSWIRSPGRPRTTWVLTVARVLKPLGIDLKDVWDSTTDRDLWRDTLQRATLYEHTTWSW